MQKISSNIRKDVLQIAERAVKSVLPNIAVESYLASKPVKTKTTIISIGKAAWVMASSAAKVLKDNLLSGIVITKYSHSLGPIDNVEIFEAGHPIPDDNSVKASEAVIKLTNSLDMDTDILFLISGGGSSLFEVPMPGVTLADIKHISEQLLKSGANITEINIIRKRLSAVKGGRFARLAEPRRIISLALSDVLGDRMDSIASGPTTADPTTGADAMQIIEKYDLKMDGNLLNLIRTETPKELSNSEVHIIGNNLQACESAKKEACKLGYNSRIISSTLDCHASDAGRFIASIAQRQEFYDEPLEKPCALIFGGETVVKVKGNGKGGRNQELALAAAISMEGLKNCVLLSMGTDGTDGPTDASGGVVDGLTAPRIKATGQNPDMLLKENDSYNALKSAGDLLVTGPTGTNVNDIAILICI